MEREIMEPNLLQKTYMQRIVDLEKELRRVSDLIAASLNDLENPQDVGVADAIKWLREALEGPGK